MARKNPSLLKILKMTMWLMIPVLVMLIASYLYSYSRAVRKTSILCCNTRCRRSTPPLTRSIPIWSTC